MECSVENIQKNQKEKCPLIEGKIKMVHVLNFMAENPFLTFFLLLLVCECVCTCVKAMFRRRG